MAQRADWNPLTEGPPPRRVPRRPLEQRPLGLAGDERLAMLAAASRAFADAPSDEQALLEIIARTVGSSVRAGCAVRMFDAGRRAVTVIAMPTDESFGGSAEAERVRRHFAGGGSIAELSTARHVSEVGEGMIVPSSDIDPTRTTSTLETLTACEDLGIDSLLLVPLRAQGEAIGLFTLFRNATTSQFDARDSALVRILADLAALAVKSCRQSAALGEGPAARRSSKEALEQARHADRLATVGAMVAGVAHEIGTPLHVIAGYAQLIADRHLPADAVAAKAAVIRAQANNITRIMRQLLAFAHGAEPDGEPASVLQVASTVAELLAPVARGARVALVVTGEPVSTVLDEQRMSQILLNMIVNAVHASPDGGTVEISVAAVQQLPPGGEREVPYVRTVIRDSGVGMSDEIKARIFEPFFTTKGVGRGTGLGLSVVEGIVKEYAGWVTVESAPGCGSRFSVFLPAGDGHGDGDLAAHLP